MYAAINRAPNVPSFIACAKFEKANPAPLNKRSTSTDVAGQARYCRAILFK